MSVKVECKKCKSEVEPLLTENSLFNRRFSYHCPECYKNLFSEPEDGSLTGFGYISLWTTLSYLFLVVSFSAIYFLIRWLGVSAIYNSALTTLFSAVLTILAAYYYVAPKLEKAIVFSLYDRRPKKYREAIFDGWTLAPAASNYF